MSIEQPWLLAGFIVLVVIAILLFIVWSKGRPFSTGDVFRASRFSAGNRLLPTQVLITPSSIVQYKPRWVGRKEESIHIAHVASVKIDTHMMLSDVSIETSGGSAAIRCHGHWKADAVRMKHLIEQYQTSHYRDGGRSAS